MSRYALVKHRIPWVPTASSHMLLSKKGNWPYLNTWSSPVSSLKFRELLIGLNHPEAEQRRIHRAADLNSAARATATRRKDC